ncbi:MAG: cytochrome-c oxidase [Alphaproteobacteria bacterium]|nr:cytochrome-c oxidase [Alphaproteobacteria bacterium]MAS48742.1 cytochrome-c oxidase [Alphaproteobacteria bacterium]MAX94459.1 cytochrome-c oxidase [Alphaproteobacteria bacterium]MBN52869.1 cytochrome-c oxidase [Alphaproteobacteria bacterium]
MQPPDFRLSDADGRIYSPGDFRGKVVVLNFVYASCPDMCPLQAEKLAAVQEMVNQTPMKGLVEFVTITTDPANDTPDVMRAYGPAHGLDPANWTFLTTAPDQPDNATRKLVEAFDQGFSSAEAGTRIHGAVTHIIDMTGRWRANFYGLGFDPTNMVLFVNALTNDFAKRHTSSGPGFWGRLTDFFN